jgi:cardiolipin synthase
MKPCSDKDLICSRPITLEQWRQRSLDVRIKEFFARMWEYWL